MKKKSLKFILGASAALFAVLLGAYLYVSSGHFITTHVLPRVAESLGADVTAEDVHFSALSSIEFTDLRVGSEADPLLRAGTIRVRYRGLALLSGRVEVDEMLLSDVQIALSPEKLEALAKEKTPAEEKLSRSEDPPKRREIIVRNVKVRDLGLSYAKAGADPVELKILNLSLDLPELAAGKDFHLTVASQVKAKAGEEIDAECKAFKLDFSGRLGQDLVLTTLILGVDVQEISGTAGPVMLDGRKVAVAAELSGNPADYTLRELRIVEYIGETPDAMLTASGNLGIAPMTAALDLSLDVPPGGLLNVIGALAGDLDFDQTAVAYQGQLEVVSGDRFITRGDLNIRNLTVASSAAGLPALSPLQISIHHDLGFDRTTKALDVSQLDAKISDSGRDVVTVKLNKPAGLQKGGSTDDVSAMLSVKVDRFDLTMLNAFLPSQPELRIMNGVLNRDVTLTISNGGRKMAIDVGGGGIDRLMLKQGDRLLGPLRIDHEAQLQLTEFKALQIDHFQVDVIPLSMGSEPAATVVLGGTWKFDGQPSGSLAASLHGKSEKLALLANPFLDDRGRGYIKPLLAGNIALDMRAQLQAGLDGGMIQLGENHIQVDGLGRENLIHVDLAATHFAPGDITLPVHFTVNELPLARLVPFLPYEAEIAKLSGNLSLDGRAVLAGPTKTVNLETTASIKNGWFALRDGTSLAAPVTPSLDVSLDYTVGGLAAIERMSAMLHQTGAQEPLLHLNAAGRFDTSMDPDVRNVLGITTEGTVKLGALEKLIVRPENRKEQTPPTPPEHISAASPPPNIWLGVGMVMDKATYGNLIIEKAGVTAEYRNGKLEVSRADALINEGSLSAKGDCDLSDPEKPQYNFTFNIKNLQFAPVLSTFIPHTALYIRGGLQDAEIMVKGIGFDMTSLQNNLVATVDAKLDQLVVDRMSGTAGKLTEALLLGIFNIGWSDLRFEDGDLDLAVDGTRFGDHDIHIQTLRLQAPAFQLDGSGSVQFGGAWTPNMEIKTGFVGAKADSLRRQGYAISTEADKKGYYAGPTIPLTGDLKSLRNQASLVTEVLIRSGKLNAQEALQADLVNQILGTLGGGSADGGEKPDVGGLIGGILGGVLDSQQPDPDDDNNEDDAVEAVGNLLQGLFGN